VKDDKTITIERSCTQSSDNESYGKIAPVRMKSHPLDDPQSCGKSICEVQQTRRPDYGPGVLIPGAKSTTETVKLKEKKNSY